MLRVCLSCGAVFDGGCAAMKCPKCVAAERSSTLRPRVCRTCGRTFDGGPRAWYCPECRAIRRREQGRAGQARVAAGTTRKLGSTGVCEICGKEYIVSSGLQRYCPGCAPDAVREIDRAQARAWARANTTPEGRRKARSAAAAPAQMRRMRQAVPPRSGEGQGHYLLQRVLRRPARRPLQRVGGRQPGISQQIPPGAAGREKKKRGQYQ